ncbi:MAG TPA: CCA tRNA nucleotidyltransferase [Pirellulales bacterium]
MTQLDPEKQHAFALRVVERLRGAGFEALLAGGCVRDQLLRLTPHDYDVATNATPPAIRELFGRRHTLEIGAAFGVIAVIGHKEEGLIEVTTFRQDAGYTDGRHPDRVIFTTAEEDAQRRDFTINGLFYDPLAEKTIDYVGGQQDLALGVVRAIGDPRARFSEDKLRMLRAVRIAARFNFSLDPATAAAMHEMAETISVVSAERIAQEMRKVLVHESRSRAIELLGETRLLAVLLPELPLFPQVAKTGGALAPEATLWPYLRRVLDGLREPSFPLALAALLHALAEPQRWSATMPSDDSLQTATNIAGEICQRWKLANKESDRVTWLLGHRGGIAGAAAQPWSRLQRLLIQPGIEDLLALVEAESLASDRSTADVEHCRLMLALPAADLNPSPLITGNDLAAHGVPPGEIYKSLLEMVRDAQLDGQIATREEALALVDRKMRE